MTGSEILIYQNPGGVIRLDVRLEDETVWLSQALMADLFGKSKKTISEHIQNIFKEGELNKEVVVRKFRTTSKHGAISQQTAAELIYCRADANLPLMGMQSSDKECRLPVRKGDVSTGGNCSHTLEKSATRWPGSVQNWSMLNTGISRNRLKRDKA